MKKPVWLRLVGWVALVSFLGGSVMGMQPGNEGLVTISALLFLVSMPIWGFGSVRWRARQKHLTPPDVPPVGPPAPARRLGARLCKLALFVAVPFLLIILLLWFSTYRVQRKQQRVTAGMTCAELMRVVDGWMWMNVHSLGPDAESVHVNGGESGYDWPRGAAETGYYRPLSRDELAERLQRFVGGTRDCQISFTYSLGVGPAKYSFAVTVGRDGKVRSVSNGHNWD